MSNLKLEHWVFIVTVLALIVSIIACFGTYLAIPQVQGMINSLVALGLSNPSAEMPTPNATTVTSTITPSRSPLTPTATQALIQRTITWTPTSLKTTTTTRPPGTPSVDCLQSGVCTDNFSRLDSALWLATPSQLKISDGHWVFTIPMSSEQDLKPNSRYNLPFRSMELRLSVLQSKGTSEKISRAGIQFGVGSGYSTFGLNTAGGVYLYNPLLGDEPKILPIEGNLGQPHTLRIEWTGTQIVFSVDGKSISQVNSNTRGDWFIITGKAPPDSDIAVNFYNVQWTYFR